MPTASLPRARRRPIRRRRRKRGFALALVFALLLALAVFLYSVLFPKAVKEIVYPLAYESLIRENAMLFDLDPARVAAVIYCESSFRANALSSAGAMGLMQIMPETGAWIAGKFGDSFVNENLNEPEINIRYGCWYLNYLDERFGGDLVKATAAYHAGGGTVDQWLANPAYSADGQALTALPDNATGAYVKNVQTAYDAYKEKMQTV